MEYVQPTISTTISPIIILYAIVFSFTIAGVLRWRFQSSFGTIFIGTTLFSLLVIVTTTYTAYKETEQYFITNYGPGSFDSSALNELIKFGLLHFGIILVANAIIAWLLQTRNATHKLGN